MGTIKMRHLDEELVERLKRRASQSERSLESEVSNLLTCAAEEDRAARRAAFLETAARLRQMTAGRKQTPAEVLIREDRDHGHGNEF